MASRARPRARRGPCASRPGARSPWLTPGDRGQDVNLVPLADGVVLATQLAVDEHIDVAPHVAALVEDPAAGTWVRALERGQQLRDRGALDRVLGAVAGQPLERAAEADEWHPLDPSPASATATPTGDSGCQRGRPVGALGGAAATRGGS